MTKHMKWVLSTIEKHGFTVISVRHKHHIVVKAEMNGGKYQFVTGGTPGDTNGPKHFEAFIKRQAYLSTQA